MGCTKQLSFGPLSGLGSLQSHLDFGGTGAIGICHPLSILSFLSSSDFQPSHINSQDATFFLPY